MSDLIALKVRRVHAAQMAVIVSIPDVSFEHAHTLCNDIERWCASQRQRGVDIDAICPQSRIDAHRTQLNTVAVTATVDAPAVRVCAYPAGWKLPRGASVIGYADGEQLTIADAIPAEVTDAVARKLAGVRSLTSIMAVTRVVHPDLDSALLSTVAGFAATLPAGQFDMLAA